jgi:hypothetical protein
MLMMENYKNVHSVHSQCSEIQISCTKHYDNNTSCISTATLEQQPSNAFHTANVQQSHLMCIYIGQTHDFSCKTKTENSNCVSTGSASKHLDLTRVGKVCLHWSIYLNNTMFQCDQSGKIFVQLNQKDSHFVRFNHDSKIHSSLNFIQCIPNGQYIYTYIYINAPSTNTLQQLCFI